MNSYYFILGYLKDFFQLNKMKIQSVGVGWALLISLTVFIGAMLLFHYLFGVKWISAIALGLIFGLVGLNLAHSPSLPVDSWQYINYTYIGVQWVVPILLMIYLVVISMSNR